MNKKLSIGIIAIIILIALIGSYFAFIPHYKSIEMSGYTFEVPDSNAEVKNNTINYNTYLDTENDLNIKTWACKDINDTNGTVSGSMEMGMQLGENMGTNVTYKNFTVYNKSGTKLTYATLLTWLKNKGCTSQDQIYSCTGMAGTSGNFVMGVHISSGNIVLDYNGSSGIATYIISQPYSFTDNVYMVN